MRNKTFDIMLAIGIIYVVMGHNYQPAIFLLPAYTFQVALFFFISGYFFRPVGGFKNKFAWCFKKFKRLIVPYYLFNLFFAGLTVLLAWRGIVLGDSLSWFSFFVRPFIDGHQYYLFLAAWFVPQLFLIHLAAQWLIGRGNIYRYIGLFLSLAATIFLMFKFKGGLAGGQLIACRTVFGLAFYLFGSVFNLLEDRISKYLFRPAAFIILYILYVSLESFSGGFTYFLAFWQFANGPLITLSGTLAAILMIYIASRYLAQSISANNFLLKIGRQTFSVMALHLLVFFMINCFFYKVFSLPRADLSNIFFQYQPEKFWFVYSGLGVIIPVCLALIFEKIKSRRSAKNIILSIEK